MSIVAVPALRLRLTPSLPHSALSAVPWYTLSSTYYRRKPAPTYRMATLPTGRSDQFNPVPHTDSDISRMSIISVRMTSLEVCYSVYGEGTTSLDAAERFYEANASKSHAVRTQYVLNMIFAVYVSHCHVVPCPALIIGHHSYENPFLTATSRSVISDIHKLSRQLSSVDVPRPLAMICTLFRLRPPNLGFLGRQSDGPLFQALRVWNDIGDISESESFGNSVIPN